MQPSCTEAYRPDLPSLQSGRDPDFEGPGKVKIDDIRLYRVTSGNRGERGAGLGESQYWGGGWATQALIANPMSYLSGESCDI